MHCQSLTFDLLYGTLHFAQVDMLHGNGSLDKRDITALVTRVVLLVKIQIEHAQTGSRESDIIRRGSREKEMSGRKRRPDKQQETGRATGSSKSGDIRKSRRSRTKGRPDKGMGSEQVGKKKGRQEKEMSRGKSSKR